MAQRQGRDGRQAKAYDFLWDKSASRDEFTPQDLADAVGWKVPTARTYLGKIWSDFVERLPNGRLRVKRDFRRFDRDRFLAHSRQKKPVFTEYKASRFYGVVNYEFLLPLTREDKLRRALDDLFYADTVERRLEEIGLEKIADWVPRLPKESDDELMARVCDLVSTWFVGYSTYHVSGRYRVGKLVTRQVAADRLVRDLPYLVDESTAIVRIIIPLQATKSPWSRL